MSYNIFWLEGFTITEHEGDPSTKTCKVGLQQDTGAIYVWAVGGFPFSTTKAQAVAEITNDVVSLYQSALAKNRVFSASTLFAYLSERTIFKGLADVQRGRFNQMRNVIRNAADFPALKTTLTNTPALTAADDFQDFLGYLQVAEVEE